MNDDCTFFRSPALHYVIHKGLLIAVFRNYEDAYTFVREHLSECELLYDVCIKTILHDENS